MQILTISIIFSYPAAVRDEYAMWRLTKRGRRKRKEPDLPACSGAVPPLFSQRDQLVKLAAFMRSKASAAVSDTAA